MFLSPISFYHNYFYSLVYWMLLFSSSGSLVKQTKKGRLVLKSISLCDNYLISLSHLSPPSPVLFANHVSDCRIIALVPGMTSYCVLIWPSGIFEPIGLTYILCVAEWFIWTGWLYLYFVCGRVVYLNWLVILILCVRPSNIFQLIGYVYTLYVAEWYLNWWL